MKTILLLSACLLTTHGFGQSISPTIGYSNDFQSNGAWYPEFGGRIGLGVHTIPIDTLPFNYSFNVNAQISGARRHTQLNQILFNQEESEQQELGFARAEFHKTVISFDYDFGYTHQIGHRFATKTFISPYVSLGPRIENYRARAHYELYPQEDCHCTHPTKAPISSTWSLGTNLQTGVKFMFYTVGVDVRAGYYMGWSVGNNNFLPIAESFEIDYNGTPTFEHRTHNYNSGFNFSVNLIFKFHSNEMRYNFVGGSGYDGSSSDDSNRDDNNWGSSSGGGSECGGGLTPSGRGGL
ncbi:MAG: hypothetical protein ACFHU9_11770 [Fluviicola sp.]